MDWQNLPRDDLNSNAAGREPAGARLRTSVIPGGLGAVLRGIGAAVRSVARAVDDARRLRALAAMTDDELARRGLRREDIPAAVYGWPRAMAAPERPPEGPARETSAKPRTRTPDRTAA